MERLVRRRQTSCTRWQESLRSATTRIQISQSPIGNGSQTKSELSRLNIKVTRLDGCLETAPGKATMPVGRDFSDSDALERSLSPL